MEVGAAFDELVQVAEQEVDVQAPLVGLVDDDQVVGEQVAVAGQLGQEDTVGHDLDRGRVGGAVVEADRVADGRAELDTELLGHPGCDRARRDATGLGVADGAAHPESRLQRNLGELGALARPGLAGDDGHLVVADRGDQLVAAGTDRQLGRKRTGGDRAAPPVETDGSRFEVGADRLGDRLAASGFADLASAAQAAPQLRMVGDRQRASIELEPFERVVLAHRHAAQGYEQEALGWVCNGGRFRTQGPRVTTRK